MLSSIRFLLCVFGSVWGSIQQSGLPGDNAAVVFDILATAKEQECTLMFADGSLESVSVGFDFLNGGVNYAEAGGNLNRILYNFVITYCNVQICLLQ